MSRVRGWSQALGRKLVQGLLVALYFLITTFSIVHVVVTPMLGSALGGGGVGIGGQDTPTINASPEGPSANDRWLTRSRETEGGRRLIELGLQPSSIITNSKLVTFLNDQQKAAGASSTGPYVLYVISGQSNPAKPDAAHKPNVAMDATSGTLVALYQDYTNGRGATCFIGISLDALSGWWPYTQTYLWNRSLDAKYAIDHTAVPQIPAGTTVNCYAQSS